MVELVDAAEEWVEDGHGEQYALPYQPMSSMEWTSSVVLGIAAAMIMRSRAIREVER